MSVRRFDILDRLDGPKLLPNGWLRADAFIARTGVQEYRLADGTVRRELRLPEEVFHPDALASFAMVPVVEDHPAEMLNAGNARQFARGHLGEDITAAGDKVRASVLITDAELVQKVLDGKNQLSAGYSCDLEESSGTWNGEPYDVIQRSPRGNHVAVVAKGRAGPEVRLHLDASDAVSGGHLDVEAARRRARLDAEEAWKRPLRSSLVVYDRADGVGSPEPAEAIRSDSGSRYDSTEVARAKMLRAAERAWMGPLSAGVREP